MFDSILNRANMEKGIISLYTNKENTDVFAAGFIQKLSDEFVLLSHVNPYGLYDGYMVKRIEDIYRIDYDGLYEKKIQQLYKDQNQSHKMIENQSTSFILDILLFAKDNNYVVSLELFDSGYTDVQGFVKSISEDSLTLQMLDDYGQNDGISVIYEESISFITCDSDNEMALKILSYNK